MSQDKDPLLDLYQNQKTFGFEKDREASVQVVGTTVEGHTLFKKEEAHGGYSYWSDEIGGGTKVYDEGTDNIISIFAALDDLGIGEILWNHIGEVYGYK